MCPILTSEYCTHPLTSFLTLSVERYDMGVVLKIKINQHFLFFMLFLFLITNYQI